MASPNDTTGKSFQRGPDAEFLGGRGPLEQEISDAPPAAPDIENTPVEAMLRGYGGFGPTRYRSTGDGTADAIVRQFTDNDALDASHIEVEVEADVVTLRGNARTKECKALAEDLALSVAGVSKVNNRLRVHAFDEVTHKYV